MHSSIEYNMLALLCTSMIQKCKQANGHVYSEYLSTPICNYIYYSHRQEFHGIETLKCTQHT
jgi:hypothetical protein